MADKLEDVRSLVANVLGLDAKDLTGESSVETCVEWDSIAHVHIVLSLEATYGMTIDPLDAVDLMSVQDIVTYLEKNVP